MKKLLALFALLLFFALIGAPAPALNPTGTIIIGAPVSIPSGGSCPSGQNLYNNSGVLACQANGSTNFANPTATAGPNAVNGSASTAMRSDAAPAIQLAGPSQFGLMEPDGTTITCTSGICTAIGSAASSIAEGTTTITGATNSNSCLTNGTVVSSTGVLTEANCIFTNGPLGEPSSGNGTNITDVTAAAAPLSGITGLGANVETALATAIGSAGAPVTYNGALGEPSSGNGTNITDVTAAAAPLSGITGLGANVESALETAIGSAGAPVTYNGALGEPSSGNGTNITNVNAEELAGLTPTSTGWTTQSPGDNTTHVATTAFVAAATASASSTSYTSAPTGTDNSTGLMMGLDATLTPSVSGNLTWIVSGTYQSGTGNISAYLTMRYGTGTAPANGASPAGTIACYGGSANNYHVVTTNANAQNPFTMICNVSGLTVGTAYWFDLQLAGNGTNTISLTAVQTVLNEHD